VGGRLEHMGTGHDNVPRTLPLALDMNQILHSSELEELLYSSVNIVNINQC